MTRRGRVQRGEAPSFVTRIADLRRRHAERSGEARRRLAAHRPTRPPAIAPDVRVFARAESLALDSINRIAASRGGDPTVPKLSAITQDKARVGVPIGDDELKVAYRPSRMTPALLARVQQAERDGSINGAMLEPLAALLVSWDLLDDDDEPIATTPEALAEVPLVILRAVLEAIGTAVAASARNGAGHA
jgi:hypothetical protein